jgi:hypothetical protein
MPAPFTLASGNELVSVAGIPISGFPTDGAAATFEYSADRVQVIPGPDGGYQQMRDSSGTLTIRLLPSSPSNTVLSALFEAQMLGGASVPGFQLIEKSSGSFRVAASCQILQLPPMEHTRDAGKVNEWRIVSNLVAGAVLAGQARFLSTEEINAKIAELAAQTP